jgi:aminoglycoside 6'-N-acetyltransferase
VIRPVADADVPALVAILRQPEVARWWGDYDEPKFREEAAEAALAWTIEADGEPAGYVQVWEDSDPDSRRVDIDIFLSADHHGRGIGAQAMRDALRVCFEERGHHRATLSASVGNERAIRVYEKIGFRTVGVTRKSTRLHGEWSDELLMELLAEEMT